MLTVEEVIALLSKIDRKAVVIINGLSVDGIDGPVNGRLRKGYYAQLAFKPVENGRDAAVFFTRDTEGSDGVIRLCRL